jgi:hypothetical protein
VIDKLFRHAREGERQEAILVQEWMAAAELAQDVRACLGRNVRQPYRVLADQIASHKAERWPRPSEEWLAAAKHDGAEVNSILINKTKVG